MLKIEILLTKAFFIGDLETVRGQMSAPILERPSGIERLT